MPTTKNRANYRQLLSVRFSKLFGLRKSSYSNSSLKRTFDLLASAALLIGFGWLIVLLIIAIRMTSSGRAIFAQERLGLEGRRFICYKLRTMYCNTPSAPTHLTDPSAITDLGKCLRRLKLDELPQLLNVIKGDMSLVGPRPCLPSQQDLIEHRQRLGVFSVRPGLTGKAQVLGVDMSDPDQLAKIDAQYIAERSFVGDIILIVRTLVGIRQR
jgi:lipopolysaccharide/colanic/teichoic acid biosynthesis glycosyltransferase